MQVRFLGGAETVTGSRTLLDHQGSRVLLDCGMFQGRKEIRERNWQPFPVDPASVDAVVLTHAHVDHSGYLPALVRDGFRGPIYCTEATRDLCQILLADSAHIHESDARLANRRGTSKHSPALPLYTAADAEAAMEQFRAVERNVEFKAGRLTFTLAQAGHILGASSAYVSDGESTVLFSGDLGRSLDVLMPPPDAPRAADWVVMESTYGDRVQPTIDPLTAIAGPIRRCLKRGGVVLVPAFAVGRTQAFLCLLERLFASGEVPRVPVHVDSPMADRVTEVYARSAQSLCLTPAERAAIRNAATFARSREDSKELDQPGPPRIIISAAGMLTGGRVLHHLKVFGPDHNNLILLPGFQVPGTRGAALASGETELRFHGTVLQVEAEVFQTSILSAHADQVELLAWLRKIPEPPQGVTLVHGEQAALEALQGLIQNKLGFATSVARMGETLELSSQLRHG